MLTLKRLEEIKEDLADESVNPMGLKKELAAWVVERFHDQAAAEKAAKEFTRVFSQGEQPEDMPEVVISEEDLEDGKLWIVKLIAATDLLDSNSQARRMIKQGAVTIDDDKIEKINIDVPVEDGMVIQIGKRRYARIRRGK